VTSRPEALHASRTARLLLETVGISIGLGWASLAIDPSQWTLRVGIALAQGCWLHRVYFVGHEAVHRKLLPGRPLRNDVLGQLALLPLLLPLGVYRKIHRFHHACNRLDERTSALDTFVIAADAGALTRFRCRVLWYVAVFAGGFFVHSLVSVVLFLVLPLSTARRVSPAFAGWRERDRWTAIAALAAAVALHLGVAATAGADVWARLFGWPMLAFAWVYSLLVYIYHYDTGYGRPTGANVRSLAAPAIVSWWLLGFNEHATHHADPSLPWYLLRREARDDPSARRSILRGILDQLRGPRIVPAPPRSETA